MNTMNSRFLFPGIALLLSASAPAAEAPGARTLPGLMPAPEFALRHAGDIALGAGQQAKIETALREMEAGAQKLAGLARRESDALAQLLAHDAPDAAAVAAQFDKVLAAEDAVKRVRLKLSLRTRAALTAEQQRKLASLQNADAPRRTASPERQELAAKMQRVKDLIERAKAKGRDLSAMRAMWKRVSDLTAEGKTAEAGLMLDETARTLESSLASPSVPKTTQP